MEKIFIDRRVVVSGKDSVVNLENFFLLNEFIKDVVSDLFLTPATLIPSSQGYLTFDNNVDPPLTFKYGWPVSEATVGGDLYVLYPDNTSVTIPITSAIAASNGLTKTSGVIKLGGLLTEPTTISSLNHDITITRFGPNSTNNATVTTLIGTVSGAIQLGVADLTTRSSAISIVPPGTNTTLNNKQTVVIQSAYTAGNLATGINVQDNYLKIFSGPSTSLPTTYIEVEPAEVTFSGELVLLDHDETRDDSGTHSPINFIYTDNVGTLLSAPLSNIISGVLSGFTVDSSTIDFTITSSPDNLTADVIPNTHIQKIEVYKGGVLQGTRKAVNLIQGSNITLTTSDDAINDRVNITIAATGGGGGGGLTDAYYSFTDGTTTTTATAADTFKFRSANNILTAVITDNDVTHGDNVLLTINQANIDHNALTNYSANRHIDHSTVSVTAGAGLSGGGTIDASINIAHADTSSLVDTANSTNTVIQNLTFDTYGHVLTQSSKTFVAADFGIPTATIAGQMIYWDGSTYTVGIRIKNIQSPNGFSTFNLPHTPVNVLPVDVYINGVLKEEGVTKDYTLSGNTLAFNYTFQSTDKITTIYYI